MKCTPVIFCPNFAVYIVFLSLQYVNNNCCIPHRYIYLPNIAFQKIEMKICFFRYESNDNFFKALGYLYIGVRRNWDFLTSLYIDAIGTNR